MPNVPSFPPFAFFRTGTHRDSQDRSITVAQDELQALADGYDPTLFEAPLVIGHPTQNAPAYGWVKAIDVRGDTLYAQAEQVEQQFADWVQDGRLKKISVSLYPPDDTRNPKPGQWYIRHIGFLGANPPAVKGLPGLEFGDADGLTIIDFTESSVPVIAGIFRALREWLLEKFTREVADQVVPDWRLQWLDDQARADTETETELTPATAFAEPIQETSVVTDDEKAALEAKIQQLTAAGEAARQQYQQALFARQHESHRQFAEGLIERGRLAPADREFIVALFDAVDGVEPRNFGEGDHAQPMATLLQNFLSANLGQAIELREFATKDRAARTPIDLCDSPDTAARARAFLLRRQDMGRPVSHTEAVDAVLRGQDQ